ncbi:MAG: GNAT family N-acetyltransferase [Candidatus Thorarchaeota archaeon]|nr:MAG: GNAT family N-acetyltransferase [Candidatus Thorarchaeota archaeon]
MMESDIELRDGRVVTLRSLKADDKNGLVSMFSSMTNAALEWGMPPYTEEVVERWIASIQSLISLVAIYDNQIVGYSAIFKHSHPRRLGIGEMGIYIHQDFHGVGLGTLMTNKVVTVAVEQGLHRLSLEVVEDNEAAVKLYKKSGFLLEGTMKDAYFGEDKKYHNTLIMSRILS